MSRKIKLIWDFRGSGSQKTAEHHCIHLKEFAEKENMEYFSIDSKTISEMYSLAYILVKEEDMKIYRDALIPHRGEIAD